AQHRNAPFVRNGRIDLAVGIFVRDHFAASGEAHERSIVATRILFELLAIAAAGEAFDPVQRAGARHAPAAAEFNVIAARESQLALLLVLISPPGRVKRVSARAVLVLRRQRFEQRNLAAQVAAHGVHDIAPDLAAGIGEAIRERRALRVEKYSRRLAGAGSEHYPPGSRLWSR